MGGRGAGFYSGGSAERIRRLQNNLEYAEAEYKKYAQAVYYRSDREYRDRMDSWDETRKDARRQLMDLGAVQSPIRVQRDSNFEYGSQAWFWQEQIIKTVDAYNTARSDRRRDAAYDALTKAEDNIHLKHRQNSNSKENGLSDSEERALQVMIRKAQRKMRNW